MALLSDGASYLASRYPKATGMLIHLVNTCGMISNVAVFTLAPGVSNYANITKLGGNMEKKIYIFTLFALSLLIGTILFYTYVFFNGRSGNYYSSNIIEVEQLSSEYYLGPTIDANKDYISNVEYFIELDGFTEAASPIGYFNHFDYKENEIDCKIMISTFPFNRYVGDFISSNVHVYKGHEIYVHDTYKDESKSNISSVLNMAHLGDYKVEVNISITNQDNYDCYKEIALEFMYELIDNYVAINN